MNERWDFFISYAHEDKDSVARPIAEELTRLGFSIWFDEYELGVGDRLFERINHGLVNSLYAVVIISPSYLNKKWTKKEMSALISLDDANRKRILPVWHNLAASELNKRWPVLSDIVAVSTANGISAVIDSLLVSISIPYVGRYISGMWVGNSGKMIIRAKGDKITGSYDWNEFAMAGHISGKADLIRSAHGIVSVVVRFEWFWDITKEKGNGYFITEEAETVGGLGRGKTLRKGKKYLFNNLLGTWAFDWERLVIEGNTADLLQRLPHPWSFIRENR